MANRRFIQQRFSESMITVIQNFKNVKGFLGACLPRKVCLQINLPIKKILNGRTLMSLISCFKNKRNVKSRLYFYGAYFEISTTGNIAKR